MHMCFQVNSVAVQAKEAGEDVVAATAHVAGTVTAFFAKVMGRLSAGLMNEQAAIGLIEELGGLLKTFPHGEGRAFDEFNDDFIFIPLDTVAKNEDQFLRDDIFGWYRVAGPNPMRLTKLTSSVDDMFPELTNRIFRGVPGFFDDSLKKAQKEGRLYYVDYPEFEDLLAGKLPDGTEKKDNHVYSPKCLLAVPQNPDERTTVLPIAIRCGQDSKFPMYTANPSHTDSVTWLAAKLTVQVADALIHEAVYHLARTHLLLEVFICATYRALAPTHPIMKLLTNHFYGTVFINFAAVHFLVNPGGTIDSITAPQIETTTDLAAHSINRPDFQFNEWMPDKELANRDVLDEHLKFPYRDDALRIWEATNEWVRGYLGAYYKNDADVREDYELANWCKELVDPRGGKLHGFGENANGEILTFDYLVRAVSMVIFTASTQHAAVNFPQATLMQHVPSMPLSGGDPAPTTPRPYDTIQKWVERMLPNLDRAQKQLQTAEVIGVLNYTTLGEYGRSFKDAPDDVDFALSDFKQKLALIGADIRRRNLDERKLRLPEYYHLVPSNIPQSINI